MIKVNIITCVQCNILATKAQNYIIHQINYNCSNDYICPFEYALNIISKKWRGLVIYYLYINGTMRFSELKRELKGITQKILTQTLRFLEEEKLLLEKSIQ